MVVVSAEDSWDSYLESLRAKAFDHLILPADSVEIERVLRTALTELR
jgi:DNA-binding NtrC family response regulator